MDMWSKAGAILTERIGDRLIARKVGGKYWMYWGETNIYAATSDDLINWSPVEETDETKREFDELRGYTAFKIVFGLEPGKCAGEFTAPDEWLKMTEGSITFSYSGEGDVVRTAGDQWMATAGTKVTLCNKGDQAAVLVGVQIREN